MGDFIAGIGALGFMIGLPMVIVNKLRKRPVRKWLTVFGASFALLMVGAAISPPSTPTTTNTAQNEEKAKAKAEADAKAKADADAKAKAEADAKAKAAAEANKPENIAMAAVHKAFGNTNSFDNKDSIVDLKFNKDNGYLFIRVFAKDGYTDKLIKEGMWMNTYDVLKALKDNKDIKTIFIGTVLPLQDKFGNSTNDTVMKMTFGPETRSKINWDNFLWNGIPKIAEDYWEHPVMQKIQTN